jgi:hypothetical protein
MKPKLCQAIFSNNLFVLSPQIILPFTQNKVAIFGLDGLEGFRWFRTKLDHLNPSKPF